MSGRICPTCDGAGVLKESQANALKTQCPKGHAYTPANTYVNPKGWRLCRTCRRESAERRRGGMSIEVRHYALGATND